MNATMIAVSHTCARCDRRFIAPIHLSDTYCRSCFSEACEIPDPELPKFWNWETRAGIMAIAGAVLMAVWTWAR